MGEVAQAIGAMRNAVQSVRNTASNATGGVVGGGPLLGGPPAQDPGLPAMSSPAPAADPLAPLPATDASQPQAPAPGSMLTRLSGTDPLAPLPDSSSLQSPTNPVTHPAQASETDVTQTPQNTPWTPPHHETTLGKIADVLLALRGRQPIFRDRVDAANEADALADYRKNPTDANMQLAVQRMSQIPDLASDAIKQYNQMQQNQFYTGTSAERSMIAQGRGMDTIGGMLNAIGASKDPNSMYTKMKPQLDKMVGYYNKMAGANLFNSMPDQWDPDIANSYMGGATSPADQQRLAIAGQSLQNTADYRNARLAQTNAQINLETKKLGLAATNTELAASKLATEQADVNSKIYTRRYSQLSKTLSKTPVMSAAPWLPERLATYGLPLRANTIYPSNDGSYGIALVGGKWVAMPSVNGKFDKAHAHLLQGIPTVGTSQNSYTPVTSDGLVDDGDDDE